MVRCSCNPGSNAEFKLLTLSCSGCAALASGGATSAGSVDECKVLLRELPQVRAVGSTTAIYVLAKDTGLLSNKSPRKAAAKVAELGAVIGVYKTEEQANRCMLALYAAGIEENALTIKAGHELPYEHRIDHMSARSRIWFWGRLGMLIGAAWGLLFDSVLFSIPGVEPFRMAAPLVGWVVAVLEGMVVFGCTAALAAGLASLGMARFQVATPRTEKFEFVVRVRGAAETIACARKALRECERSGLDGFVTHASVLSA